jgi:8-oxo-dGTP diphosphatase
MGFSMEDQNKMVTYRYPRPAVTVDALVFFRKNESVFILLIRRGGDPFRGKWALPGGFVDMDELLEHACRRELKEETGLSVNRMDQFKTFDAIHRDPRHRTLSVVFSAELSREMPVQGGDDADTAGWFSIHELPEMAFDHREIIGEFFHM